MTTLELAKDFEAEDCYAAIEEGRRFQREQGFVQWEDNVPNLDTIRHDIERKQGYAIKSDGAIAGYFCLHFRGEPAYDVIEGQWSLDAPYGVVHRIAVKSAYRGTGVTADAFRLIGELCRENGVPYVRIDTAFPNRRMQHVLKKNGFTECGTIYYSPDKVRIGFDKTL